MPEKDVVDQFGRKCCSPDPVQRVAWGYGSKVLPLAGNTPSELQRVGAARAEVRAEVAGWGSARHRDEWGVHGGYIGEPVLGAGSRLPADGVVGRATGGWKFEPVAVRRQVNLT